MCRGGFGHCRVRRRTVLGSPRTSDSLTRVMRRATEHRADHNGWSFSAIERLPSAPVPDRIFSNNLSDCVCPMPPTEPQIMNSSRQPMREPRCLASTEAVIPAGSRRGIHCEDMRRGWGSGLRDGPSHERIFIGPMEARVPGGRNAQPRTLRLPTGATNGQ